MDLIERQLKIEDEYTVEGIQRAIAQWEKDLAEGNLANTGVGRTMIVNTYAGMKELDPSLVVPGQGPVVELLHALAEDGDG